MNTLKVPLKSNLVDLPPTPTLAQDISSLLSQRPTYTIPFSPHPFYILELAELLCEFVDRKDLLSLALSCRGLFTPAIVRLWRSVRIRSVDQLCQFRATLAGQYGKPICRYNDIIQAFTWLNDGDELEDARLDRHFRTIPQEHFFTVFDFPSLRILQFSLRHVPDIVIAKILYRCRNAIEHIALPHCYKLTSFALHPLHVPQHSNRITTLHLFGTNLLTAHLPSLANLESLQATDINDTFLEVLSLSHRLKRLALEDCHQVTNYGLTRFCYTWQGQLTSFQAREVFQLNTDHVVQLARKSGPALKELIIRECLDVETEALEEAAFHCPNLEVLRLPYMRNLGNTAFQAVISECRFLRVIDLTGCITLTESALLPLLNASTHQSRLEVLIMEDLRQFISASTVKKLLVCSPNIFEIVGGIGRSEDHFGDMDVDVYRDEQNAVVKEINQVLTDGRSQVSAGFKRLPFYCCALSLQPFEHPVCTDEGIVFDLLNIIPYIKKYGTNPVTGQPLDAKSLTKLHFHKNAEGDYCCPVTFKAFSDHTAISAIKTTGQVYAYDTIEKLNIKAKLWRDLVTDEPFKRDDIIMIQDPHHLDNRNLSQFHYLKNNLKVPDAEKERQKRDPAANINPQGMTGRILKKLKQEAEQSDNADKETSSVTTSQNATPAQAKVPGKATPYNAAHYSTGRAAASFTSTAMAPSLANESALIDEDEYMYKHIKTKGYARIVTNLGNINVELSCDKTPRTCHNFILLAKRGYYKGVSFHRSIKHFMIQGGDPTGTGRGGESAWGKKFADEFKFAQTHNARGLLSMANSGKDTNGSQFFITYRPCTHLDNKHTIFGKMVGGMDVLDKMEAIPTDEDDRPQQRIRMIDVVVFVDPYQDFQDQLAKKLTREAGKTPEQLEQERKKKQDDASMTWFGPKKTQEVKDGVGRYLAAKNTAKRDLPVSESVPEEETAAPVKKIKSQGYSFGNFDSW
ncbi:hypothetical protein BZG36_01215 [Bifiguratus adelaidae]|uniref:RING-type E3 ubiquitin transferase n=1 Tax=Bifiguratus adelaidae TaxID=1938954 RepID=A0A261Y5T0_9FUNG|nr:hypothetical protein BZG36_01215 [Bifiguratus adelaidae]